MTRDDLLALLESLFHNFASRWKDPDNLWKEEDGSFTPHGLCSEFSGWFVDHHAEESQAAIAHLFASVESVVAADPGDLDPVANALCTCFLENIARTAAGDRNAAFMGPTSRR